MLSLKRIAMGVGAPLGVLLALLGAWAAIDLHSLARVVVMLAGSSYGEDAAWKPAPAADRPVDLPIRLEKVAVGITQPTDIQFPPGGSEHALVLEKTGAARWLKMGSGTHNVLFHLKVLAASEEGLLGAAFHPKHAENGRLFLNYVVGRDGKDLTRVEEWRLTPPGDLQHAKAEPVRVVLEQEQPYPNHNAGQIAFGPDGFLYVGFGDGGLANDPHGHGQNPSTWLGSMLRLDVDGDSETAAGAEGKPQGYRVPPDNPFVGKPGYAPETWAYGLRNPWRYSFDSRGRLIVADVGQNAWEEIDIVRAGDNLGWSVLEGFACAKGQTKCSLPGAVPPIFVYDRAMGSSITGGFVYEGARIPSLRGRYVFGDFGSGILLAIDVPNDRGQRVGAAKSLGRHGIHPSTFGRDANGELYVADFVSGAIYRIAAATESKPSDAKAK